MARFAQTPAKFYCLGPSAHGGLNAGTTDSDKFGEPSVYKDRLLYAATLAQTKEKLLSRSPDIVYFCGRCQTQDESLALALPSSQGDQLIDFNELAVLWENNPPQILILSLVADAIPEVGTRLQTLVKKVPLILVLRSPLSDVQRARRSVLKWLHHILNGDEYTDPVAALHLTGNQSDIAWAAYDKWQVHTLRTTPHEQLARLLLDRWEQRTMVRGLVDEMRQQGQRRLTSFVAYGEHGNLVDQAAEQFMEYMRRHASEAIRIQPVSLSLPQDRHEFDLELLRESIQRQIFSEDVSSEAEWLAGKRPRSKDNTSPFLFISFGCRGTEEDPGLTGSSLKVWVAYCSKILAPACPDDMGLLCCLALERPKDNYPNIAALLRNLMKNTDYNNRLSRHALLPPFGDIDEIHLKDFLDGPNNSSCPDKIIGEMAGLISTAANGNFSKTVAWVEQAEAGGWYTVYDQLKQQYGVAKSMKTNEKPSDEGLL